MWAIPAPSGGSRAFCDRMNAWAQGEGQPGLGYIFWRNAAPGQQAEARDVTKPGKTPTEHKPTLEILEAAGPIAKNIGPERAESCASSSVLAMATRCSSPPATRTSSTSSPARRAPRIGAELKLIDENRFEFCLDRRLPDVRVERGGEEDRLLAQPVLDAAGRARALEAAKSDEDRSRSRRYQYDIVCNGFELVVGRGA